ncbi:uncharacterized protein PHACADRAFT_263959 [Phanerochaete carnosa HHB-10118-sp]|uniref:Uncharacterized protein n=1 Tax=Phanerochaete carnosa (strain HHB-10118-sp) TaxID=650164 RepID=K5WK02_PHACS|nr:uncharacterized protein PHACADRAFT_263959 [Phanerochaete carnosa HHB-10118-sp]EKM50592.1 hypothetical protein PHACADRAFT_263959 [Phanerochaete carnosa HHB-10118-sp]
MVLYHNVGSNLSVGMCRWMYNITGWMFLWGIGIAELILIIRTWAIWGRDKRIGLGLSAGFLSLWIVNSYFLNKFLNSLRFEPAQAIAPSLQGCLPVAGGNVLFIDFVLLMVFETVVLGLTVFKMVHTSRRSTSPLVRSLYRDGIFFYLYLFAISLVNVVVLLTTPREFANLLSSLQRSLHSMLSARLLLNLREASVRSRVLADGAPLGGESALAGETGLSSMRFTQETRTKRSASAALFSVDDGAWVDGESSLDTHTSSEASQTQDFELGPVSEGRRGYARER